MLIISLVFLTACGGSGNQSSSSSGSSSASTENSSASAENSSASKENSSGSQEMDSTQSSDNTQASSGAAQTGTGSVVGDWEYEGTIDSGTYDIKLDLEPSGRFEFEVDQDTPDDIEDSKMEGTYVSDDKSITLSVATVQDPNGSFSGTVVQNEQLKLDYTLSDDGRTLTLTNIADSLVVPVLPDGELVLYKDL